MPSEANERRRADSWRSVLIHAPFGQDAALIAQAVTRAGLAACVEQNAASLASTLLDCGCAVISSESLTPTVTEKIIEVLAKQPPWSDVPIIILTGRSGRIDSTFPMDALGNVTLVHRPLSPDSLVSVVLSALRARRRQYEVERLIAEIQQQKEEIVALNGRLQQAMTETHHRVKNNLQIIAAMVDMRLMDSKETIPADELQRIGTLTRSLSTVHDILTQQAKTDGEAHNVSARAVFESLVPMLQHTALHRQIELRADDAEVTSRQGTSLALITSELVANALKHGRGVIRVDFEVESGRGQLCVEDEGPGFPPNFDSAFRHTGLELVENLSRWDLAGAIEYFSSSKGGAGVRVSFPLRPKLTAPLEGGAPDPDRLNGKRGANEWILNPGFVKP